jgi:hypothetical protein
VPLVRSPEPGPVAETEPTKFAKRHPAAGNRRSIRTRATHQPVRGDTMVTSRLARVAVALVGTVITLFAGGGVAAADESGCQRGALPTYKVENAKLSHSYDNFDHGPEWMISGYAPGTLILSKTVESSNSFSVSVEIPTPQISAALGFDVTESVSFTASFEFEMPEEPRGHKWILEAGTRDEVYVYDVQRYCGNKPDGRPVRGRAEKTGHLIYQHGSEAPGNPRK